MNTVNESTELDWEKRWERVEQGTLKARLNWDYVLQCTIAIENRDLNTPVFKALINAGYIVSQNIASSTKYPRSLHGWLQVTEENINGICKIIGDIIGAPKEKVRRAIFLQDVIFTFGEMALPADINFEDITLPILNNYIYARPPISAFEFDILFRGDMYGELSLHSLIALSLLEVPKKLTPFPKRPRRRNRTSGPRSDPRSINDRGRHLSSPANISSSRELAKIRDEFKENLQKYEEDPKKDKGELAMDLISHKYIPKNRAIMLDKMWYDKHSLQLYIQHKLGNSSTFIPIKIPHSGRVLTRDEYDEITRT